MEKVIQTLIGLETEASRLVNSLAPSLQGATLITLSGELGAGKTAFTKAVARALGVEEVVSSPTFVLEKIYLLPDIQPFRRLIHIDAYRLENGNGLDVLGFDEIMKDTSNLILLEWPEKVAGATPNPSESISLTVNADGSRTIIYG